MDTLLVFLLFVGLLKLDVEGFEDETNLQYHEKLKDMLFIKLIRMSSGKHSNGYNYYECVNPLIA